MQNNKCVIVDITFKSMQFYTDHIHRIFFFEKRLKYAMKNHFQKKNITQLICITLHIIWKSIGEACVFKILKNKIHFNL